MMYAMRKTPQERQQGLCTPREAAEFLRVTPRTVARWCRDGQLQAIKVGHVWRVCTFNGRPILRTEEA